MDNILANSLEIYIWSMKEYKPSSPQHPTPESFLFLTKSVERLVEFRAEM